MFDKVNSAYKAGHRRNNGGPQGVSPIDLRFNAFLARPRTWWALSARRAPTCSKVIAVIVTAILMSSFWKLGHAAPANHLAVSPQSFQALKWRNVGPFRGGRTSAVAGIASEPYTFYIGTSGGGVWKTKSAGTSWTNVSDGYFKAGSIGAVAAAPSNPDVVYVGTGEASIRNHSTSPGNGVYKSTDGGKTWVHLGLDKTLHIASIVVDPKNANVVYIGAQGNPWAPSEQRGVYRSRDGGKTWQHVLFVNGTTGAHSLTIDPEDPNILYAGMWDYQRTPWHVRSGGPGSGLWKSVDGGGHWQRLTAGLPKLMGNVAVSVSPADPSRVYAMIEAVDGGVFRSDDAGQHWGRVNSNHGLRTRAWYYTIIVADPVKKGTVYVLGDGGVFGKSTDGGQKFTPIRVLHGDNHALWINPRNNQIMVEGNDGGGTVSLDGGANWSSENNQPTGQFYRVFVDNGFPYRLYGSQQDAGTASVPSRSSNFRGISVAEEYTVGGGEDGHIGMNLKSPNYIYAAGMLGSITRYDHRTKQVRDITAYPYWAGFRVSGDLKYRFSWTAPVVTSQFDPNTIYMGAQVVLKSTDKGESWHPISPDLTANNKAHQIPEGGPISILGGGYQTYDTIVSIAESPFDADTLWAGSDDGFVHVTRDGGRHWADVTPPEIRKSHAYVRSIGVSRQHQGSVHIAANRYRFGDFTPMMYVTHDFGKTWKSIVHGIPGGEYVNVVREDPDRAGVLYAGTDRGVYVSFHGGDTWQPLQLNLPVVPITDLRVHGDDLVAATQGRSFWILDGLGALRELAAGSIADNLHLFKPSVTYLMDFHFSMLAPGPFGENPPAGVVIRYNLPDEFSQAGTPLTLEILGPDKKVIAQFTSAKREQAKKSADSFLKGAGFAGHASPLPVAAGMNSYVWDMSVSPYVETADVWHYVRTKPYRVAPGTYYARLVVGRESVTQSFKVASPPNYPQHSSAEWAQQQAMLRRLGGLVDTINRSNNVMRTVARQIKDRAQGAARGNRSPALCRSGYDVVKQIAQWEQQAPQPPLQDNVQDYNNWPARSFSVPVFALISAIDQGPPLTSGQIDVAKMLESRWAGMEAGMKRIEDGSLAKLNGAFKDTGLQAIKVPVTAGPAPVVPAVPEDFCTGER